jgi:hypothetical protein
MARTTFSGPVKSDNGFEGAITGNVTGDLTGNVTATTGTSTFANVEITGNAGIGNAGTDTIGFYGATKIVRPTTAITGATTVAGTGTAVTEDSTFDGYTIAQVVKALRNLGLLT